MKRLFLKQMAAMAAAAAASPFAFGQSDYPNRPIRMLVPYPPGGSTDPIARLLGQKVGDIVGQTFVVENRPGGNTSIASSAIVQSEPDGYNLLFSSASTHVIHTMQSKLPYDSLIDFTPIGTVSRAGYVMTVHPSVPAKTLPELIAYAKANPGKLNYASAGIGNANHLAGELFNMTAGVKMAHVPYKGAGAAMTDLLSGRVQVYLSTIPSLQQHIDKGSLRAIAYTSQPPGAPPVVTFEQHGMKDFDKIELVTMVLGPKNLPKNVVTKLSSAMRQTLESPDVIDAISKLKQTAFYMPPDKLAARLKSDRVKFAEIIEKSHIKLTES